MYAKKRSGKKVAAMLLAVVLLIGVGIGGTLAWLMDTSNTVTNTFSVGNINIDLAETVENDGFKILPGTEEKKDPVVTVEANSEDCWVFIQVQEVNNAVSGVTGVKYVTWNIDDTVWTELSKGNGVITYYATTSYTTQESDKTYNVLKDTEVSYGEALTKEMIDKLYNDNGSINDDVQPQLVFKAFAVQNEAATTADKAWIEIPESEHLGYVASTP